MTEEPFLKPAKDTHYSTQRKYLTSSGAAAEIGISDQTLQKITDCVFYVEGQRREPVEMGTQKRNIALQLKSKKNVSKAVSNFIYGSRPRFPPKFKNRLTNNLVRNFNF